MLRSVVQVHLSPPYKKGPENGALFICGVWGADTALSFLCFFFGDLVGEGWNRSIGLNDPSAHAEILALRDAGQGLQNYRLPSCSIFRKRRSPGSQSGS